MKSEFPAIEAYEKEERMKEETKGIMPIEEYEMMLDRLLRRLDGYSQPPRYMVDCCSTVARMCEAKRSLSETRRFREAMELAEQFKDAIEMEMVKK